MNWGGLKTIIYFLGRNNLFRKLKLKLKKKHHIINAKQKIFTNELMTNNTSNRIFWKNIFYSEDLVQLTHVTIKNDFLTKIFGRIFMIVFPCFLNKHVPRLSLWVKIYHTYFLFNWIRDERNVLKRLFEWLDWIFSSHLTIKYSK